jgi:hypothetical protein
MRLLLLVLVLIAVALIVFGCILAITTLSGQYRIRVPEADKSFRE